MSLTTKLLIVASVLCFPLLADAQVPSKSSNVQYCEKLSGLYARYVGQTEFGPRRRGDQDVSASVAIAKCDEGNAAAAIPVLERKLTDARITLPSRSISQAQ